MRLSGTYYFREVQIKGDTTGPEGRLDLLIGTRGTEINYNYVKGNVVENFVLLSDICPFDNCISQTQFFKIFRHCLNG